MRALALLSAGALIAAVPAAAAFAHPTRDGGGRGDKGDHGFPGRLRTVVDGLNGPRGLATTDSKLLVTEIDGTFSAVKISRRHGDRHDSKQAKVIKLGQLKTDFSPAVDVGRDGTVWLLTGGGAPGTGAATLYKWRWGDKAPRPVADIGAYQQTDPDPNDLEGNPTDSNPFGVAALRDGSVLVADAGGNDLLRVVPGHHGKSEITTVARLKPRIVKVPKGLPKVIPGEGGDPDITPPPAGTKVPAEAVATSVTVGHDGAWYVGELRGFPATPRTSEIWRIEPGTEGATCDPQAPNTGDCKRFADGLTSIMDLAAGQGRNIDAVEFSKKSWLAAELQVPGAQFGAAVTVGPSHNRGGNHDRHGDHGKSRIRELTRDPLVLPGGIAVNHRGDVFVTGPVLPDAGPGSIWRIDTRSRGHH